MATGQKHRQEISKVDHKRHFQGTKRTTEMRKLLTPEDIILKWVSPTTMNFDTLKNIVLDAQRDALECASENTKASCRERSGLAGVWLEAVVDKDSILNLMPKEK